MNRPTLIVVCGLMGTGKSTLASALAKKAGLHIIRSDEVRKALTGIEEGGHRYESFGEGIYSARLFDETYNLLFKNAGELLKKGEGVIMDASFKYKKYRLQAHKVAKEFDASFLLVECCCPEEAIKKRLEERSKRGEDISDGRWDIFLDQKGDFEPVDEIPSLHYVKINTENMVANNVDKIIKYIPKG